MYNRITLPIVVSIVSIAGVSITIIGAPIPFSVYSTLVVVAVKISSIIITTPAHYNDNKEKLRERKREKKKEGEGEEKKRGGEKEEEEKKEKGEKEEKERDAELVENLTRREQLQTEADAKLEQQAK